MAGLPFFPPYRETAGLPRGPSQPTGTRIPEPIPHSEPSTQEPHQRDRQNTPFWVTQPAGHSLSGIVPNGG